MMSAWVSGKYRAWYDESLHKDRIDGVGSQLVAWKYCELVVRDYLVEWLRFARDFEERCVALPTGYRSPEVEEYFQRRLPAGGASRLRAIRSSIRLFLESDSADRFTRRVRNPPPQRNALFLIWARPYIEFHRLHGGLAQGTLGIRSHQLGVFTEFLAEAGVSSLGNELTGRLVQDFFCGLGRLRPATRLGYASTVRQLLRWAYLDGRLPSDLSGAVMTARRYRHAGLPNVLSEREVEDLLGSVDRSKAVGRRDLAVLLLAARYGMRPSDIRQLKLENVDWRGASIAIRQQKTGRELVLPLLPDVAEALIAYLREGRPATDSRFVFVRHRAPFEPFLPTNSLTSTMRGAFSRSGLQGRAGRRGICLFRHCLATRLLAVGVPFKTIGDLLGHATTDSTLGYAKVDLPALRSVALGIGEVMA